MTWDPMYGERGRERERVAWVLMGKVGYVYWCVQKQLGRQEGEYGGRRTRRARGGGGCHAVLLHKRFGDQRQQSGEVSTYLPMPTPFTVLPSLNPAMLTLQYNLLPGTHTSNCGRFHRVATHIGVLGLLQSPAMLKTVSFPQLIDALQCC